MLLSLVRPGDVVLDVGAHIGTFSIPLGRAVGESGQVYSFEPVQESLQILEKNISTNGQQGRVIATNTIITDKPGNYSITLSDDHTSAAHFSLEDDNGGSSAGITTTSLDEWGAQADIRLERLDVMKIDTEGMELRVLRSAKRLIEDFQPVIMAEMSGYFLARQGDSLEGRREIPSPVWISFLSQFGSRATQRMKPSNWHVSGTRRYVNALYDLVAVHPSSDRYPSKVKSGFPSFLQWLAARTRNLPGGIRRRLLGS